MDGAREAFAHRATLVAHADTDLRAPGGAVTEELCGSLDHQPPCPLAAHFTSAERGGDGRVAVRVLFACQPADEPLVRTRIDDALARSWDLVASGPDAVRDSEAAHATRLVTS